MDKALFLRCSAMFGSLREVLSLFSLVCQVFLFNISGRIGGGALVQRSMKKPKLNFELRLDIIFSEKLVLVKKILLSVISVMEFLQ